LANRLSFLPFIRAWVKWKSGKSRQNPGNEIFELFFLTPAGKSENENSGSRHDIIPNPVFDSGPVHGEFQIKRPWVSETNLGNVSDTQSFSYLLEMRAKTTN
jgi:hypothetical protein